MQIYLHKKALTIRSTRRTMNVFPIRKLLHNWFYFHSHRVILIAMMPLNKNFFRHNNGYLSLWITTKTVTILLLQHVSIIKQKYILQKEYRSSKLWLDIKFMNCLHMYVSPSYLALIHHSPTAHPSKPWILCYQTATTSKPILLSPEPPNTFLQHETARIKLFMIHYLDYTNTLCCSIKIFEIERNS